VLQTLSNAIVDISKVCLTNSYILLQYFELILFIYTTTSAAKDFFCKLITIEPSYEITKMVLYMKHHVVYTLGRIARQFVNTVRKSCRL